MTNNKKNAIYIRLENKSEDSFFNIDRQINYFLKKVNSLAPNEFYIDIGYSGANEDRPAYQRLIKDIKIKNLYFDNIDRISRDFFTTMKFMELTNKYNVKLIPVKDNIKTIESIKKIIKAKDKVR